MTPAEQAVTPLFAGGGYNMAARSPRQLRTGRPLAAVLRLKRWLVDRQADRFARPVGARAQRIAASSLRVTEDLLGPAAPEDTTAAAPAARRFWARLRGGQTIPGLRTMRLTLATVSAYVVAGLLLRTGEAPVVAALTALLVVQMTPYQTVKSGWQRIGSVIAGVLVAVLLSTVVGLTWWSLGVTVLASLIIAHVLRLGDHALEVPISAMLVLTVAGHSELGFARVYETLIGAGVGVLVSLLTPQVYVQPAGDAIGALATEISQLLRSMAADLEREWTSETAMRGLKRARELQDVVARARQALARAEDSVRFNARGWRTAHVPNTLRPGLTALEYAAINLRVVNRVLVDRVDGVPGQDLPGPVIRGPLARLLEAAADAVTAFGDMVAPDVAGPGRSDDELRRALDRARAERIAVSKAMLADAQRQPEIWHVDGALLAHIDRLLAEIDPESETVYQAINRSRPPRSPISLRKLSTSPFASRSDAEHPRKR
jgi:uncharacterized membrane protein YgaE (UPF0421/DUF939 family)